jgi:hypothetical protein
MWLSLIVEAILLHSSNTAVGAAFFKPRNTKDAIKLRQMPRKYEYIRIQLITLHTSMDFQLSQSYEYKLRSMALTIQGC